jgi:hypothetical protein
MMGLPANPGAIALGAGPGAPAGRAPLRQSDRNPRGAAT